MSRSSPEHTLDAGLVTIFKEKPRDPGRRAGIMLIGDARVHGHWNGHNDAAWRSPNRGADAWDWGFWLSLYGMG
jgi:hypothetical protein